MAEAKAKDNSKMYIAGLIILVILVGAAWYIQKQKNKKLEAAKGGSRTGGDLPSGAGSMKGNDAPVNNDDKSSSSMEGNDGASGLGDPK